MTAPTESTSAADAVAIADASPKVDYSTGEKLRVAAEQAWEIGDWHHAARLMDRAQVADQAALEAAYGIKAQPDHFQF
jgi:hypothetical protein